MHTHADAWTFACGSLRGPEDPGYTVRIHGIMLQQDLPSLQLPCLEALSTSVTDSPLLPPGVKRPPRVAAAPGVDHHCR